jgi:hypothetical protein
MSLSSSKIERGILGLGKNPLLELVLGVEVTLVSKFHSIWSSIAHKSTFGRKGGFWEEKSAPETSYQTLSRPPRICPKTQDFVRWEVSGQHFFTILVIFC